MLDGELQDLNGTPWLKVLHHGMDGQVGAQNELGKRETHGGFRGKRSIWAQ